MKAHHDHENIIDLYDVLYSESGEYVFIILEYCDCGDLSEFIKNNRLGEDSIKYYMNQLRNGLKHLRKNNVIHRDLKPKNILLMNNYKTLKIADFGFARTTLDEISLMDTLCGSPLYMAPEMMNNKKYNVQSDLWSIGVILYEMIYRQHPYGKPMNILDLMDRLNNRVIEFPESDVSNECINLLKTLLKTSADGRINWDDFFNHPWFDKEGLLFTPHKLVKKASLIEIDSDTESKCKYLTSKTSPIDIPKKENNLTVSPIRKNSYEENLMFSIEMEGEKKKKKEEVQFTEDLKEKENILYRTDLNSSVIISKSDYNLEDILYEDHMEKKSKSIPIEHIRKDGTLVDFEIVDKKVPYVGSLPIEQRARSYSKSGSILKNSLAYLSTSLQILKSPTSKLFNMISQ